MNIDEAVLRACQEPTLVDALSFICLWESERMVKQVRTNPTWDTCFKYCIDQVMKVYPIPMILHCPQCHMQHIDIATKEWNNPPHRSHECQFCKCIWRPADFATAGVNTITTKGSVDTWTP